MVERPHVVKPVGQLDEDDANVVDHRQQHLAEVFGLALFARRKGNGADLRDAFHDMGDLGTEQLGYSRGCRQRVFDDVVEEAGGDGHHVELHVGQQVRHLERMHEIRLARMAHLALVLERRKGVRPAQQLEIRLRAVASNLFEERLETNHAGWCLRPLGRAEAGPCLPPSS